jgi:glycosyltransferase involved in cell wall biosynthesis
LTGLRVLHVIGGGDSGGAMTHLLPLVSALSRAGCDVRLLCLGEGKLAEEASLRGSPVAVLAMGHAWDASVIGPLSRVVTGGPADFEALQRGEAGDSQRPGEIERSGRLERFVRSHWDVVHTHGMRANLPVRLVMKGRRRRSCLFTTVHSDLRLDYASQGLVRFYRMIDRATLQGVDRVICVSDALRRLLIERGYPAERLITIRSGIELPGGRRGTLTDAGTPGPRARSSGPARLGTVARLVPVKDIDLLLEVAALLRRTHPGVEVVIVGDGPEAARLEDRARAMGLAEVARFTGRREDVAAQLAGWDVYLVTSTFEGGVSMSVLEAMASAVPVVTTSAGGVEEAVKDGETGFVVSRAQGRDALAAALAERAALLLDNQEVRARMGPAGARRVRDHFSIERTALTTMRAYERCLAARGALL